MNLIPCGHRVLVQQERIEEVDDFFKRAKQAGIAIVDTEKRREQAAVVVGTVKAIGPTAWKEFGGVPWCEVGDRIYYAKYAGFMIPDRDDHMMILNDEDVIAVVKE